LCSADWPALDKRGIRLMIATEVVYARSITFNYSRNDAFAAQVLLDAARLWSGVKGSTSAIPGLSTSTQTSGPGPDVEPAKIREGLDALNAGLAGNGAGVRLHFRHGTSGKLALQADFARPMAIGFGGYLSFPMRDLVRDYAVLGDRLAPSPGDPRDEQRPERRALRAGLAELGLDAPQRAAARPVPGVDQRGFDAIVADAKGLGEQLIQACSWAGEPGVDRLQQFIAAEKELGRPDMRAPMTSVRQEMMARRGPSF
jgi:hypothetical protein